jgi:tripartite-type tricarboxylate transporter receptor subunit TctC
MKIMSNKRLAQIVSIVISTCAVLMALAFSASSKQTNLTANETTTWPMRPIRLVHSLPMGYAGDLATRQIAEELSRILGQVVTVNNRPASGGLLAMNDVAQSAADGYTFLACDPRRLDWPEHTQTANTSPAAKLIAVARGVLPVSFTTLNTTISPMKYQSGLLAVSGLCAPKNTPAEIVNKMRAAFNAAMITPASIAAFKDLQAKAEPLDGAALNQYLNDQRALLAVVF